MSEAPSVKRYLGMKKDWGLAGGSSYVASEDYDALAAEFEKLKERIETQQKRITKLENALTLSYQSRWQVERRLGDLVCAAEARVSRTHKRWVKLRDEHKLSNKKIAELERQVTTARVAIRAHNIPESEIDQGEAK
ncbi:hypothetical protein M0R72_12715 [Candidatus Pacearchaeota archaeon]|jgi:septal ring factor EnvC (AmiA/AmiB activator)|nr:hypothetical protein [Candidatus Pacearchaeota archaeon]